MILIAECKGWDIETQLLSEFSQHPKLFPILPSQTRFNRRRRNLGTIINRIRQILLSDIEGGSEKLCVIDSLPIPVIQFHLAPSSSNDWSCYGANYGWVESRKQTIFDYKLHLLVTASGVIVDFELAPASATDLSVGYELLSEHQNKQVIGDKAYIGTQVKDQLAQMNHIHLITLPRRNQKQLISKETKRWINETRQIVETVNGQLTQQSNEPFSIVAKCESVAFCDKLARIRVITGFPPIFPIQFPSYLSHFATFSAQPPSRYLPACILQSQAYQGISHSRPRSIKHWHGLC